jgi:hypothetical protein
MVSVVTTKKYIMSQLNYGVSTYKFKIISL